MKKNYYSLWNTNNVKDQMKALLVSFFVLFVTNSYSQDEVSSSSGRYVELFARALPGQTQLSFHNSSLDYSRDFSSSGISTSSSISGSSQLLSVEHGFSAFSLGAAFSKTKLDYSSGYEKEGVNDLQFYIHSLMGKFYWKVLFYSPMEEPSFSTVDNKENTATGSHFDVNLGVLIGESWGLLLEYEKGPEYTSSNEDGPEEVKVLGSDTTRVRIFKEFGIGSSFLLGFYFGTSTHNDGEVDGESSNASDTTDFSAYSSIRVGMADILLSYVNLSSDSGVLSEVTNITTVGIRLNF